MSDLIDRQAASYALNTIKVSKNETWYSLYQKVLDVFSKLPSAERNGKWIDMGDFEQCSVCTGTQLKAFNTVYGKAIWIRSAYCPNCGAKMDGGGTDNGT